MKTKNLIIIFVLFLLTTLASAAVVYFTNNKTVAPQTAATVSSSAQPNQGKTGIISNLAPANQAKPAVTEKVPEVKVDKPEIDEISVSILINGVKYDIAVPAGNSVYDLMNQLKQNNKIDFSGKNYPDLGFFVEEINGVKNNPSGENWVYYINSRPAQIGVSNYKIKNGDAIEWKYEKKSF